MRVNYQYLKKQLNTHLDIISCRDEFSIESGSRPKGGIIDIKEGILSLGGEHIDRKRGKINFEPQKLVTREFFDSMTKGKVKNNDILINKDGAWTGKVGLLECEENEMLAVNEHNFILRAISINQKYAFYFFFSELGQKQIIRTISGSAQPGINSKFLKDIYIPIPPISEQKKIAKILSTVDETIEKTSTIIEETRQLKKGLMQKLFTEGIGHTKFKETEIGIIPEEWEINRLNNFGEFLKGKSINKSEITESGFPCVRYGDIYVQYEFANTVTHFSAFIGEETADNGQRIKYGDIIFAGTGETQEDIGKCVAYVRDDEAYAGGDLFLFRPSNGISINSEFLSYCLNSGEVGRLKSRLGQGLSIFHIYPSHVQTLEVPLPTIEEQNQIVKILNEVDAKIEKEEAVKAELEQLKKGLMQVLLTGKVRVKA